MTGARGLSRSGCIREGWRSQVATRPGTIRLVRISQYVCFAVYSQVATAEEIGEYETRLL